MRSTTWSTWGMRRATSPVGSTSSRWRSSLCCSRRWRALRGACNRTSPKWGPKFLMNLFPAGASRTSERTVYVAVIGASNARPEDLEQAENAGRRLAELGAIVVTGGRRGVMEAACRGAKDGGGLTVVILPG